MKGVMGMWVNIYDQFVVWSLRSLNVTLLSLHFKKLLEKFKWHFHSFLNCLKQTRYEEVMKSESKGVSMVFFLFEQAHLPLVSLFLEF